MMTST